MSNIVVDNVVIEAASHWMPISSTGLSQSPRETYHVQPLVPISTSSLFICMVPLVFVAFFSWSLGLELESPIIVGLIRSFVQLSVLGLILHPIFVWGTECWWVVAIYVCLMLVIAANISTSQSKYHFRGQFSAVLSSLLLNVLLVSLFAFGFIVPPTPIWNPQYVIPIVGMLLSNCINGISLSLDAMLTNLMERQREVELYLSFGASSYEASLRLIRESVKAGSMPILNCMAVIGIVSIPGMMTGQILAGSPIMDAARYQIFIIYVIATCTFGAILMVLWIVVRVGFDASHMLRTDRFEKRTGGWSLFINCSALVQFICRCFGSKDDQWNSEIEHLSASPGESKLLNAEKEASNIPYNKPKVSLTVSSPQNHSKHDNVHLDIRGIKRSVLLNEGDGSINNTYRILFNNISCTLGAGEIRTISGPSGTGKSQLLRVVAGLSPMDDGDISLCGKSQSAFTDMAIWRQQVRYVTQYKVDVPGTPSEFIHRITSLQSFKSVVDSNSLTSISSNEMITVTRDLVQHWGLHPNCLQKEWLLLSGGEAQRVILAIALASRPKVLLLDVSTSALDPESKRCVERSIDIFSSTFGMSVLWVTHDQDQADRMRDLV